MRGTLLPTDAKAVALVGSRNCSSYGKRITERLATGLARAGYTIVSGLARGIDGAAHRAALQAGGRTVGVLAGGLSRIYPPEHADLAREIDASGALLSEATMDQEPLPAMFPARNRIISGLCRGVVVIEAADRSGALLTATHAGDQGRPVMAIPGPVDHATSGGTNALIRKGAVLVRGSEDVLEELEGLPGMQSPELAAPPPALDDTQRRIWDFLGEVPRHLDEMVQALGIEAGPLSGKLLMLEMKKAVRRLPGNRFERS
jgi:DNA processing protein